MRQKTTFTQIVLQWLDESQGRITYSTKVKYEQLIRNYIKPFFDSYSCVELEETVLQKFYRSLNLQLSNGNIRTILMIVNNTLEYAYLNQILLERLYIKPCLSKAKPMVHIFSTEEQIEIENYIFTHHDYPSLAVFLALYTGMRIGELCALKWSDLDFKKGSVEVTKTVQRLKTESNQATHKTELVLSTPKSSASYRIIPLPDFAGKYIADTYAGRKREGFLLTEHKGIPMDPRTLQYAYKKMLKRIGVPYLNFHCLRHTFATRCVTMGWDMKTLSEVLGHSDIKITMEYYFHSSFEYKKEQMNKFTPLSEN